MVFLFQLAQPLGKHKLKPSSTHNNGIVCRNKGGQVLAACLDPDFCLELLPHSPGKAGGLLSGLWNVVTLT